MTRQIGTVALAEEINAAFSLAEDIFEFKPGEPVEDHGDPPPFGETEEINDILASCDLTYEGM